MEKICSICGTSSTRKWYIDNDKYICQKDYRKARYLLKQQESIEYQRNYYKEKKEEILYKAKQKYLKTTKLQCHQKIIRDKRLKQDLLVVGSEILKQPLDSYIIKMVPFKPKHREFIKIYEWLGSVGNSPKWTCEATCNDHIAGVVLFNEPSRYSTKILKRDTKQMECLIQRGACVSWAHPHLASKMIMFACRWLSKNTTKRIFVAYSDPAANEIGTIYQACNFDYLGDSYGAKFKYENPKFKKGRPFSAQSLRRTSTLKKFLKEQGIQWDKEWQKQNGFKDLSKLPTEYKTKWYEWGKRILAESKKIPTASKRKYVLVLGKDRREQKKLNKEKAYEKKYYPKRTI